MSFRNEYLLKGSEELSREFNDLASIYSDFYKDVYGVRPRDMALCACDYANERELLQAFISLKARMHETEVASVSIFAEENRMREQAIKDFETNIAHYIQCGANNRATAIGWLCQAYDVLNKPGFEGWEHLEYNLNIPYGYVEQSLEQAA